MRVLIAGVGYQNLRDMSVAHAALPVLQQRTWPIEVEFDDLSFGPIAVVQRFQDRPEYYDRVVFVSAAERGRAPGRVYCSRWSGVLPPAEAIQESVREAVTGVISLDNLLVIAGHFGALPGDVRVVEIEPQDMGWGPGFSPAVESVLGDLVEAVWQAAVED